MVNTDHGNLARTRVAYARAGTDAGGVLDADTRVLVDKLGARMAFDRTGVRLYEALASKLEAYGGYPGGPTEEELEDLRNEELEHEHVARALLVELGGDPRRVSASANLELHACRGVLDVLVDPRTPLVPSLEALLIAELVDHESWNTLAELAASAALGEVRASVIARIESMRMNAAAHLSRLRGWLKAARR
jgi:hypothetical protein